MNALKMNYFNSLVLVVVGLWGYLDVQSPTALIPVFFGLILFLLHIIMTKKINLVRFLMPLAFVVTVLIFAALGGVRLPKSLDAGGVGLIRVVLMVASSGISIGFFIKTFFEPKR